MSGEQPSDPYTHWRRRAEAAEAEVARLNMEMAAYREKLTPADAAAMVAVVNALYEEKKQPGLCQHVNQGLEGQGLSEHVVCRDCGAQL